MIFSPRDAVWQIARELTLFPGDVIACGTSVGAMVGASYLAGNLDKLEEWVLKSNRSDVYRFFDIKFTQSGFVDVGRLDKFIHNYVVADDIEIDDLDKPFMAVATCLNTGQEIWSREGNVSRWVRASCSAIHSVR